MTLFGRVVPDERVTRIKFVLIAAVWSGLILFAFAHSDAGLINTAFLP